METTLLTIIIGILVFHYILELIGDILNVRALDVKIPEEFKDTYNQEKYATSQRYLKENVRLSTVLSTINICILIPPLPKQDSQISYQSGTRSRVFHFQFL